MKSAIFFTCVIALLMFGIQKHEPAAHRQAHARQTVDTVRIVQVQFVGLKKAEQRATAAAVKKIPGILDVRFVAEDDARVKLDLAKISTKQLADVIKNTGYTPYFH